ncbi:MAG: hypothetical protein B7X66_09895 [Sphingomonadales bacterium 39-57-19]|nr:MAG: hypothetical protein B7X66_09895 [Sphingomonadales bacterium 39-57-19]
MNGDVLTKLNFGNLMAFHRDCKPPVTMCVREHSLTVPYGVAEIEGDHLKTLIEKPTYRHLVNAGIYVCNPEIVDIVPRGRPSTMVDLVHMLMKLAPIGAFGAIAFTIGEFGIKSLANLAALVATFYLTSLFFVIVVLGAVAYFAGFSIFKMIRYLREELLLVLGTSSSEAALPSLMEKLEIAGARKSVVGLVVPTGYSFNLDGTNIYMTLAALFIAQAVGIDLSLSEQFALVLVAMISSKGAAGVTGAGFVILATTLSVVPSVPVAGMALILGIDRFMSECRALTNFIGNAVATIVVARWEGALDTERLAAAMAGAPTPLPEEDIERHERSGPHSEALSEALGEQS